MAIEREIKLTGGGDATLPDLADANLEISVGRPRRLQLAAVYYDTPSFSLARSGVTLRSRTGDGKPVWTLKVPISNGGAGLSRVEFTFDEPLGPVPAAARIAARAYVRTQTLDPVVRLHTERTEVPIVVRGVPQAMLVDDRVEADAGTQRVRRFREVEVEWEDESATEVVDWVVGALRDAGFREDEPTPKAIRVLGGRASDPPDVPLIAVDKRASTGTVVRSAVSRSVAQMITHHAGAWLGTDAEDVHQFRVATRRLRSDLRTFAPLLDRRWTAWLRDELKWLGAEVGMARDADVLAARLRAQMELLPAADSSAVDRLGQRLADNSVDARRHVIDALGCDRYVTLLDALVEAARQPRFAADAETVKERPAGEVVTTLVRKPWRKLRKAAEALTPEAPDSAFHAVRISAKKARYAAEAVAPVYGARARRLAKSVERVQSVLGDHQDTAVAEAWLRRAGQKDAAIRLVVGELITVERIERLRLREEFARAWKKASRGKLSAWVD